VDGEAGSQRRRIWIHAASIGEIKAARIVIDHLQERITGCDFILTTMTIHGRDYARAEFPARTPCYLAPLDVPLVTDRVARQINPFLYICLETELWPLLIHKIRKQGAPAILLNGRISDKSISRYERFGGFFRDVLQGFARIGAISEIDRARFIRLGADPGRVSVTGNIKHEVVVPDNRQAIVERYRSMLAVSDSDTVFIAGSTHAPEEELLLPLVEETTSGANNVWVIAPRHLDRLEQIETLYRSRGVEFLRFSDCARDGRGECNVVLLDTFGDLAQLYSIATFVFVGGSLSNNGGHNLMEAAIWDKPVAFGPYTQDFQSASEDLEQGGGGFRVRSVVELTGLLKHLQEHDEKSDEAGRQAGAIARTQQGAALRQVELIVQALQGVSG
jgi:3-deoxy-D-manno-octulosonic-acid transferase